MRFKKGDIVAVYAEAHVTYIGSPGSGGIDEDKKVWTASDWVVAHEPEDRTISFGGGEREPLTKKILLRRKWPVYQWGLVIGYTRKATGHYWPSRVRYSEHGAGEDVDPPYLEQDKRHLLVVVEPCDRGDQQYREPWLCLEEDLRLWTEVKPFMDMAAL